MTHRPAEIANTASNPVTLLRALIGEGYTLVAISPDRKPEDFRDVTWAVEQLMDIVIELKKRHPDGSIAFNLPRLLEMSDAA